MRLRGCLWILHPQCACISQFKNNNNNKNNNKKQQIRWGGDEERRIINHFLVLDLSQLPHHSWVPTTTTQAASRMEQSSSMTAGDTMYICHDQLTIAQQLAVEESGVKSSLPLPLINSPRAAKQQPMGPRYQMGDSGDKVSSATRSLLVREINCSGKR